MVSEIRLYIEGGGDHRHTKGRLASAFGRFFGELRDRARERRIRWNITVCGGRNSTFDAFKTALDSHPAAFNVLLVDAEARVVHNSPWRHLAGRPGDKWQNPGAEDKHCHLMVQTMEAWLIADRQKLREYYGPHFRENALPNNPNVEQIDKDTLARGLKQATRNTKKGEYHKTRHAPGILENIRLDEVKSRVTFCQRMFDVLIAEMDVR